MTTHPVFALVTVLALTAPALADATPAAPAARAITGAQEPEPRPRPRAPRAPDSPRQADGPGERFTRTLALGPAGELEVSNVSGHIRVAGGAGPDVQVEVTKRVRRGTDAERQLELVQVDIQQRGERAEIRTVYPRGHQNVQVAVHYDITVPAGTRVYAKSVAGNIHVSQVKGGVRAETVSGDVRVEAVGGLMLAKSVSGDVHLVSAGAEGELSVSSVSGNVRAQGLKASSLDLGTVSGDLVLRDVVCSRANIRSVSGNLQYTGELASQGRYELKSHSGNIQLALVGDPGFELDATSFSGRVQSDLPLVLRSGDAPGGRRQLNRTMRGIHGDGGARLEITTFSGDISISRPR